MVLVDTSIWVRFLANRLNNPDVLESLLGQEDVVGHSFVFGELLIGDIGGRSRFLASYESMIQLTAVSNLEVVQFVIAHKLLGRVIGRIDAHLLSTAMVGGARFWTADLRLNKVAEELGVAYSPSGGGL